MSRIRTMFVSFVAIALLGLGASRAQTTTPQQQQPTVPQPPATNPIGGIDTSGNESGMGTEGQKMLDSLFLRNAERGNLSEVEMGRLALSKSQNTDVRQFAQRMVADHSLLSEKLQPVAKSMEVRLPTAVSKKQQKTLAHLQGLSAQQFDQAYIQEMVRDHKQDEDAFVRESQDAANPKLKAFATQAEAMIHEHKVMAEKLAKIGNSGM